MIEDNTAVLTIRQGKILYTVGVDVGFSDDMLTRISFNRLDSLLKTAKRNILIQILEKDPEGISLGV